jgi:2-(1,2-epoxy-1,2-dihydrophenyl)acetyl-CoA isomerase
MAELVSESDGPIHRLTINVPARRNALTPGLARALAQEIEQLEENGETRAILLSGAGGHFCAGLDLHWLRSLGTIPNVSDLQHGLSDFQSAVIAIVHCPIPVIAVVQGTAAGFGFDLALVCDMRLAGSSAIFSSGFARIGLVPDGGSTFTLPRLVGVGRAMRVLMTGELECSAPSIRSIKRLTRATEVGALEQALSAEGAAQLQALQSPEFRARLEAFAARLASRGQPA